MLFRSAKGALWLDPDKTSPYEFYQYFRNVEDAKTAECLKLLTFVELDEIQSLTAHNDERMNAAKERLAYEVTALVHGKEAAEAAQNQARAAFGGSESDMQTLELDLTADSPIVDIMTAAKVAASKSEARRLIEGGGVRLGDVKAAAAYDTPESLGVGKVFVLHKGKKVRVKISLK